MGLRTIVALVLVGGFLVRASESRSSNVWGLTFRGLQENTRRSTELLINEFDEEYQESAESHSSGRRRRAAELGLNELRSRLYENDVGKKPQVRRKKAEVRRTKRFDNAEDPSLRISPAEDTAPIVLAKSQDRTGPMPGKSGLNSAVKSLKAEAEEEAKEAVASFKSANSLERLTQKSARRMNTASKVLYTQCQKDEECDSGYCGKLGGGRVCNDKKAIYERCKLHEECTTGFCGQLGSRRACENRKVLHTLCQTDAECFSGHCGKLDNIQIGRRVCENQELEPKPEPIYFFGENSGRTFGGN